MCAINGITRNDTALVERMNLVTSHRGPDGSDVMAFDEITLGHNRLAIIDTSDNGAQPMLSHDKSLVLVFNGEIYNFQTLRNELSDYVYHSNTDSEVILAAYERWGVECVKRFNGIFAFAIWDAKKKVLFLARDPFGVKPLYYTQQSGVLAFSSEIKALLEVVPERKLNLSAFHVFMHVHHAVGGEQLIHGVYEFPPGNYAVCRSGELQLSSYWKSDYSELGKYSKREYVERIRNTIDDSTARQLISDRPVGLLLSGGIDSSTLLATATKLQGRVKTYTTSFERESSNLDAQIAVKTAKHFGADHTEVHVGNARIADLLEEAVWHLDTPIDSPTIVSQLSVAKAAGDSVKVLLGGDGGDELFAGYTRYNLVLAAHYYQLLPRRLRQQLSNVSTKLYKLNTPAGLEQFKLFYTASPFVVSSLLNVAYEDTAVTNFYHAEFEDILPAHPISAMLEVDRRLLRFGSLLRTDKLFMSSGIEARVPLLDIELARLADIIPAQHKVSLFDTKIILKESMRDRLPEYLFNVQKRGWISPVGTWMQQSEFKQFMKTALSAEYHTGTRSLFNWSAVEGLVNRQLEGDSSQRILLWALLSFQVWARKFNVAL